MQIKTPNQHQYRPDIDGLRAIAVIAVIVHHLSAALLPGGFVGVDIFFVISGYLITTHIYKESRNGTFSIKQFYQRRINRIAPALVLMILVVLAVGVLILSPADLVRLNKSAISAIFGFSNIFFWREYGNYFDQNVAEAPLLHTWSLGVEEQFYVVWPLIIFLLIKFTRPQYLVGVMFALTIGGLAVSEIALGNFAFASYYLLPTRFFELMIGGVLSLFLVDRQQQLSRFEAGVLATVGFLLIGGSLFFLNKSSNFPGINALWPCLGAALLILAGNTPHPFTKVLTNRLIVGIGLISYSLYLWHWPIIAYLNYLNIEIKPLVAIAVILVSILFGWLSWKFVETPMRRTGVTLAFSQVFWRRFALPVLILLAIGAATFYTKGFPIRFDPQLAAIERTMDTLPEVLRSGCDVPTALYETLPKDTCRLGQDKPKLDGILIGDSFANHFTGMVDVMAKAEGISIMDYTMHGCPPILGYDTELDGPAYAKKCRKRNELAYAKITERNFSRVILAGHWPTSAQAGTQLMSSIDTVLKTGAELTIVLSNESIDRAHSCPVRRVMYGSTNSCDGKRIGEPAYFAQIRSRYPKVHIIDPNQVICTGDRCSPLIGAVPLYRDAYHLNDVGSRLIGESLLKQGVSLQ
jgi:peptidoglycan/LPS O-acetylase OafA/YrhL